MGIRSIASHAALALAAASTALLVLLGPMPERASGARAQGPGEGLFGRAWIAKAIVKDGERVRLEKGTRLVLRLLHGGGHDFATWYAGCNHFAARLEVTPKRLRLRQIHGTAIGCKPILRRQDKRITRFLGSGPRWRRKGRRLILRSGDDAIRLKRRPPAAAGG